MNNIKYCLKALHYKHGQHAQFVFISSKGNIQVGGKLFTDIKLCSKLLSIEEYNFVGCNSMYSGRSLLTFRVNVLPSSSGCKRKPSKTPPRTRGKQSLAYFWNLQVDATRSSDRWVDIGGHGPTYQKIPSPTVLRTSIPYYCVHLVS
jgi:hypothetical protein